MKTKGKKEIIIVNGTYNEKSLPGKDRKYALYLNFYKSAKVETDFKESTFMKLCEKLYLAIVLLFSIDLFKEKIL